MPVPGACFPRQMHHVFRQSGAITILDTLTQTVIQARIRRQFPSETLPESSLITHN